MLRFENQALTEREANMMTMITITKKPLMLIACVLCSVLLMTAIAHAADGVQAARVTSESAQAPKATPIVNAVALWGACLGAAIASVGGGFCTVVVPLP